MKTNHSLISIMLICLLFGISGTVQADDSTCPGGTVQYAVIQGDLLVNDLSCVVKFTTIQGDVIVDNTGEPNALFVMENTIVKGIVVVKGGQVVIDKSTIVIGLTVNETQSALITHNKVLETSMLFNDNQGMLIYQNVVPFGDINCVDNPTKRPNYYATGNLVPLGNITCFGQ